MTALDAVLDVVMELSLDDQEMLLEIAKKHWIEARRAEIAASAYEARELFRAGKLKPEPLEVILEQLHKSLDD